MEMESYISLGLTIIYSLSLCINTMCVTDKVGDFMEVLSVMHLCLVF